MGVRRRIAAIVLFGVQLLQGVLPAAGASCERQAATAAVSSLSDAAAAHHHHSAPDASNGTPAQAPVQQHAPDAACPMAMTCTVVGVISSTIAVSTVDVAIDVHRPMHAADWPVSLDIAPEPPPPRG